jgi:hypothetical protein
MPDGLERVIGEREARVHVTYNGEEGTLPDPVSFDATDGDVRAWVTEAVRTGGIPGIPADPHATFQDFVVERFTAKADRPYNKLQIRPKTPFG